MKNSLLVFALTLISVVLVSNNNAIAQGGCTDPNACNFDPTATVNDGSCVYMSANGTCIGAIDDSTCVSDPSSIQFNVLDNDVVLGLNVFVLQLTGDPCFHIVDNGQVIYNEQAGDCCGDHFMSYALMDPFGNIVSTAEVFICVNCPKPDCTLVNLEDYMGSDVGVGNPAGSSCVSVCENSNTTFYLPFDANSTYVWGPIIGGTWVPGANDAEIIVTWGAYGSGSITVTITDANGQVQTVSICVNIMQGPTASFTGPNYVCLGQNACFTNTSTNADTYFWDFGDGGTSSLQDPCYTYLNPGTYTITMCASNFNYDAEGNPLCCCTQCVTMEIVVDPLPGPNIYCISTLCEGDSACYWTDATNCASYIWTVLDANGNPVTFTGQGTDEICLQWLTGPFGTITLDVAGCDSTYCNNPTSVTIPIISSVSTITGPIVVCENSTETYTLPKWMSVVYNWTVTGGTILSGDSTHVVTIQWGSAGTGTIHVDYCSEFLEGLPEHENPQCCGTADLTVKILPEFSITNYGPSLVCLNSTSFIQASPVDNYTWTVVDTNNNPAPFVGQGTDNITISWTTAGTFIITAVPVNAAAYCNASETLVITVMDVAKATGITGPTQICPNQSSYYTAQSASTGVTFVWTAQNGTVSPTTGTTVGVMWGPTGPYSLSLAQQLNYNPFCSSDTITLIVYPKNLGGPFTISGSANCTNSVQQYTLNGTLHPDATINWSVSLQPMGSVVNGQGTSVIDVQWNNTPGPATVSCDLTLCGVTTTISLPLNLVSPQVPVVTQSGSLCPGGSAFLNAAGGCFNTYSWSTGNNTANTPIFSAAQYSLTTTDCNNCPATVYYNAVASTSPPASISSGNDPLICIALPHAVTMVALCNGSYTYEWFCNSVSVSGPSLGNCTYSHVFQGVVGTYTYYIQVVDPSTGCTSTSLPFNVFESTCPPVPGCTPDPYTLSASGTNQFPNCNNVNFTYAASANFTFGSWSFGDGNFSGSPNPTHTYTAAGCYNVIVSGTVPGISNGLPANCVVTANTSVCVPLAADFTCNPINCTQAQFTNLSSIIPPGTYTLSWNAGVAGTSIIPNPIFTFPGPGTYPVTLTITDANGCTATKTKTVTLNGVGAPIISVPISACVGDPVVMSASATGAVSYFWDFGDGSFYTGASPSHTYLNANTYTIIVTATDSNGCTATSTTTILIYPPVAPAVITGPLVICAGGSTTLCAPSGYSYNWTPGNFSTPCITVNTAGTYAVTITDGNGCSLDLDPVEVVVLPLPVATIAGNLVICDAGCTILTAPYDPNFAYQWYDNLGNIIPLQVYNQLYVCDYNLLGGYYVEIVDQNGCVATSATVVVTVAVSPVFTITVSPTACAGQPVTLTVSPIDPNVNYNWSNGGTGTSITVTQAGTYTCVGTNVNSGCTGNASATVFPLPDFCIVPQGCYETCNPDTVCGPSGMASYQWNMNGNPITGGNTQCIGVTSSGIYTLTATTVNGCTDTSADLELTVIECDSTVCDDLHIDFAYLDEDADGSVDSCCVLLSYTNNLGGIQGLNIYSNDADLNVNLGSVDPALQVQSITNNSVALINNPSGSPIPTGTLSNFIQFCLSNVTNSPAQVIIDWYDFENAVVCSDTIEFNCPVEPDCLYMSNDSIYCEDGVVNYQFIVCNPHDGPFNIGYIYLDPISPAGIIVSPPFIDITGSPILPGTCQTFTVNLSGPSIEGQTFCYNLIAHDLNPNEGNAVLCCIVDTTYCIDIPTCDPCLHVHVEAVEADSTEGCCYNISLNNAYDPNFFTEIAVCVLSPQTTITVNNPFGSGWTTSGYTGTAVSFLPQAVFNNYVPGGVFSIPQICVQTNLPPNQLIEIKWMQDSVIVCRDTIEVGCEPPCGYIVDETIECDPVTGAWIWQGAITNTSGNVITAANISFSSPAGMNIYDQTIPLGALNPNTTSAPFSFTIGPPALPGDTVCMTVQLVKETPDSIDVACCFFEHCFALPDCIIQVTPCLCDDQFLLNVSQGLACNVSTSTPYTYQLSMLVAGYFSDCDQIKWKFGDGTPTYYSFGPDVVTHTFPGPGSFTVCLKVVRTADDGTDCSQGVCKTIVVPPLAPGIAPGPEVQGLPSPPANMTVDVDPMVIFPNPNTGIFKIKLLEGVEYPLTIQVFDNLNQPVKQLVLTTQPENSEVTMDITQHAKGIYYLQLFMGEEMVTRKIVVY